MFYTRNDNNAKERQKIYDLWHKEVYQLDLKKDIENFSFLHTQIFRYLHITEKTQGNLLDIACGKGLFLKAVADMNTQMHLFGTDISSYAIEKAKKIVSAKFSVEDGENLSLKSNYFDYVTCLGGLEYYQNSMRGIQEIKRVLKDSGIALIFVPNLMFWGYVWLTLRHGSMPTHGGSDKTGKKIYDYSLEKFYTYQGWVDLITNGGLDVVASHRFDYMGGTRYAHPLITKLYNSFFYKLIPFHLCYSFVFICKK